MGSSFPGRECGAHDITLSPTGLRVQEGVGACVEGQNIDVAYTDSVTERCLCSCLCAVVCVLLPVHFRAMSLEQQPPKNLLSVAMVTALNLHDFSLRFNCLNDLQPSPLTFSLACFTLSQSDSLSHYASSVGWERQNALKPSNIM